MTIHNIGSKHLFCFFFNVVFNFLNIIEGKYFLKHLYNDMISVVIWIIIRHSPGIIIFVIQFNPFHFPLINCYQSLILRISTRFKWK